MLELETGINFIDCCTLDTRKELMFIDFQPVGRFSEHCMDIQINGELVEQHDNLTRRGVAEIISQVVLIENLPEIGECKECGDEVDVNDLVDRLCKRCYRDAHPQDYYEVRRYER